ncbi:calpain-5-like [Haliotis rufescens]|uniref:calpain-5-like n=1 Tax=Haliotis rufescens TaxID=6454 RepID=UPI00201E981B|nr:calpain-5-like [Haliotis rufescens]XP_048247269.1 calpain-5-like [Haliotis rufescens]
MASSSTAVPRKGQKYGKLKRKCVKKNALFLDGEFPPSGSSLFYSRPAPADIVWKRPKDIVPDPRFFIDKASADDFSQGSLGNCWFVAACACIAEDSTLWKKVVPDYRNQEWAPGNKYAGIFHFKFWRCGQWEDVVIDDYLPTRQGRLIFMHSKSRNEFWSALLEKAYAKLFGSYEALTAGKARDAMVDMTGGVGEGLDVSDYRSEDKRMRLFDILLKAMDHRSLMSASIVAKSAAEMEVKLSIGLVKGHAYSVTDVRNVHLKGTGLFSFFNREKIQMIRLRNPWGGVEWRGPWSDGSAEWQKVSEKEKKDLGLTFDENGEFWMSFDDFCRYFTQIDICHMINTRFFTLKKTWTPTATRGEWKRPMRAGGCGNHASFLKNPQYIFEVYDDEEEVMISLEQEDRRSVKCRQRGDNFTIGVTIMKTDVNRKYRMHDKLDRVHATPFVQARSIFSRFSLTKGRYLLVPSTFDPGQEGSHVLRIFTAGAVKLRELTRDEPKPPGCMGTAKVAATAVTIVNADGLVKKNGDDELQAYCILKCEGKVFQTTTSKKGPTAIWGDRVTLYRKKPQEDVVIEMWQANLVKDTLVGSVTLPMSRASEYKGGNLIRRYELKRLGAEGKEERTGFMWLKVNHTTNMSDI